MEEMKFHSPLFLFRKKIVLTSEKKK